MYDKYFNNIYKLIIYIINKLKIYMKTEYKGIICLIFS